VKGYRERVLRELPYLTKLDNDQVTHEERELLFNNAQGKREELFIDNNDSIRMS
jgi:hypothetical protein